MQTLSENILKLVLTILLHSFSETAAVSEPYDLQTSLGTVTGFTNELNGETYYTYLGIPYALPPVGDLRFAKPQPYGFFGSHNGTKFGNICPASLMLSGHVANGDEDCLILNIQTRLNNQQKRPVMVWIHGGGFYSGSANEYPGDVFVTEKDIVYVAINYRVGYLGFSPSTDGEIPANLGLWDQHMAFKWVRDNIGEYGGDTSSITIFGESAGAGSAMAHMLSSHNDLTLFQRVISQSSPFPLSNLIVPKPLSFSEFASLMGCTDNGDSRRLSCLRELDPTSFINISLLPTSPPVIIRFDDDFFPSNILRDITAALDDVTLQTKPETLEKFSQYDLILGANSDEGVNLVTLQGTQLKLDVFLGLPTELMKIFFSSFYLPNVRSESHREFIVNAIIAGYRQDISFTRQRQLQEDGRSLDEINLEVFKRFTGDMLFYLPTAQFLRLRQLMNGDTSTFSYEYNHRRSWPDLWPTLGWLRTGADHFDEVPLVFGANKLKDIALSGSPISNLANLFASYNYTLEEKELSSLFLNYWTSFAEFGAPESTASDRDWPAFTDSETHTQIGTESNTILQRRRQSTTNLLAALDKAERQWEPDCQNGVMSQSICRTTQQHIPTK